ncbi:hypothetical protein F5Y13DRAFT_163824 [Hypoxylon sp. FL1857]|nr:hypothetical protein F5Y13DRAFT_163824 [Hypoxylon sp. FL1857]
MDAKASEPNAGVGEFVFLDDSRYDFVDEKVTVLGATLFSLPHKLLRPDIDEFYTNVIQAGSWGSQQHFAAHRVSRKWLLHTTSDIEKEDSGRAVIILTHFCPTREHIAVGRAYDYRYTTNLGLLNTIMSRNVKLWAFGSTHYNCDYLDMKLHRRFYSNQRGRIRECAGFKAWKVVEVTPTPIPNSEENPDTGSPMDVD